MDASQVYILISILVLLVIGVVAFFARGKRMRKFSPLVGVAFGFVLAGIIFGEDRWFGYGLIGTGVVLAVVDMILRWRK